MKDMRKASFDLRVGAQVLEDVSLDERNRHLSSYAEVVGSLTQKAQGYSIYVLSSFNIMTQIWTIRLGQSLD